MTMQLLVGRKYIVAGGSSGIGAASARAFVRHGASVACLDVNEDAGRALASELAENARFLRCDVQSETDVDSAVDEAVEWLGGLNGVVDVAGIQEVIPAAELTVADWDRTLNTHARGTFLVNRAAFRHLRHTGGRIINTGSGVANQGQRNGVRGGDAHYAAAKAAIMAWTRGIAREWGQYGITANTIVPATWTPMYERLRDNMDAATLAAHDAQYEIMIPISGRLGDPDDDFAPAVVFLASDMSHYITGQVLAVNGGLLMYG